MFARFAAMKKSVRRFVRARKGSAAVEFAFIVIPFFLLTVGVAEISMLGFAQTSLDFAVSDVGRAIRTGNAQLQNLDEGDIKDQLCDELTHFMVLDCDNNLYLDVQRFDSFLEAAEGVETPVEGGEFNDDGFGYQPGLPSEIVVVRSYYRWEVITPLFESIFANVSNGERVLVSTMMFRNEPYQ